MQYVLTESQEISSSQNLFFNINHDTSATVGEGQQQFTLPTGSEIIPNTVTLFHLTKIMFCWFEDVSQGNLKLAGNPNSLHISAEHAQ
jgi:hypothetical protein